MYRLTNKASRAVGLPSPYGSVVLEVDEGRNVTGKHFHELMKSEATIGAIDNGLVTVKHLPDEPDEPLPERGVKVTSKKRGEWFVIVNGYPVNDDPVSRKKAHRLAKDYQ